MERKTKPDAAPARCRQLDLADDVKAEIESRNALAQYDAMIDLIDAALKGGVSFRLKPEHLQQMNAAATTDTVTCPGEFRDGGVEITNSDHVCAHPDHVLGLVNEMCDFVEKQWDQPAIRLAAFVLWRINAIHPFVDGNGRTARAISYIVLCLKLGCHLPGSMTIPAQMAANKQPYYEGLRHADAAFKNNLVDVSALELMLGTMLAIQLQQVIDVASGVAKPA